MIVVETMRDIIRQITDIRIEGMTEITKIIVRKEGITIMIVTECRIGQEIE